MSAAVLLILLLLFGSASAMAADDFVTYLLPVYSPVQIPGARGSAWAFSFVVLNDNDEDVLVGPCSPHFAPPSDRPCPPAVFNWPKKTTLVNPTIGFGNFGPQGRLFYVRRDLSNRLHFALHVRNISPSGVSSSAELPVLRDREFLSGKVHLLDIPISSSSRHVLRIYDLDDRPDTSVLVRVLKMPSNELVRDYVRAFEPSGAEHPGGLPFAPGYVQISFDDLTPSTTGPVRVEIESLSTGTRLWAFVSVTNNETQHVTTITPQ